MLHHLRSLRYRIKGLGYRPSVAGDEIDRQRRIWAAKPQVRSFYEIQVFPRILRELPAQGPLVEVGSGAGTLKARLPRLIATDVLANPWLDLCCSALELPFSDGSLTSVVAVNVLHHLSPLGAFWEEVSRVLAPGGTCVCVEPWMTPCSRLFYGWIHQEDCHAVTNPMFGAISNQEKPMYGNSYLPYQALSELEMYFPSLQIKKIECFSGLGWCLSKGFREGALLPNRLLRILLKLENLTNPLWSRLGGLNALILIEHVKPA